MGLENYYYSFSTDMGTGAHSDSIGVGPEMPGQSLRPVMPRHELPEWADSRIGDYVR